jgi:NADH:quinone reductase (non-electrogenic)
MNVTIVGGGFGGVKTALELAKHKENQITLISDKPDFQYYPALYGAATGHNHLESWVPLSEIFAGKSNITLKQDTITSVEPSAKTLGGASGAMYPYEKCVLALGAVTTYFGIEGLDIYAYGIKSEEEIERLKQHLYSDIVERKVIDKRYVVIGGGPTGVELAAALGSYVAKIYKYYGIENPGIQIDLIEAAPRILPKMHEKSSHAAMKRLKKLGVNVQVGQAVEQATADSIMVGGQPISSHTIIWTSGVANHPFFKEHATIFKLAKNGKVEVDEFMKAADNLYVIGDNAATPFTGLAQTALHDALFVSANLMREAEGKQPKKYRAVKPPVVVPIGENWAVFEWHWLRMHGWIASLLRRAADLIGYSDMLPLGQALGVWHASLVSHDDDLMPSQKQQ